MVTGFKCQNLRYVSKQVSKFRHSLQHSAGPRTESPDESSTTRVKKKNRMLSTVALPSGSAEKPSLKGLSPMILVGLLVAKVHPQPVYNNVPLDYLRV
jgi:hypothetical protein